MAWSKKLAIDLGTANSLVYVPGEGIVLNEPTVVAVSIENESVVAVGNEAKLMLGRTPGHIMATRPMRDGVIADYVITEAMLRYFIQKVIGRYNFFKPEVMICVPAGCTQVERRAVLDASLSAGAKKAYLIDEPLAAAIGAGVPIAKPSGNMIIDIGGGAAEAAVISLGGVVAHKSVRIGGNRIDEAIGEYIKRQYNLFVGDQTAEEIKLVIGSATELSSQDAAEIKDRYGDKVKHDGKLMVMEVKGRDSIAGLPKLVTVTSKEVTEAIRPVLLSMIGTVKSVMEETPPELASDIIDKGVIMTGGTSSLRNFDRLMTTKTGVPCHVAEEPMLCVAKGTGVALENLELYKRSIVKW